MTIDKEKIIQMLQEKVKNAKPPECPKVFEDMRLEDAFLNPEVNDEGYSEDIPGIWNDYSYIEQDNGVRLITTANSRVITNQYSKYLDTDALVWDSYKERLLIYISDPENPKMAFKGSSWLFAKRLRPEFADLSLEDIYLEAIKSNN
jgi:hypothetical protein